MWAMEQELVEQESWWWCKSVVWERREGRKGRWGRHTLRCQSRKPCLGWGSHRVKITYWMSPILGWKCPQSWSCHTPSWLELSSDRVASEWIQQWILKLWQLLKAVSSLDPLAMSLLVKWSWAARYVSSSPSLVLHRLTSSSTYGEQLPHGTQILRRGTWVGWMAVTIATVGHVGCNRTLCLLLVLSILNTLTLSNHLCRFCWLTRWCVTETIISQGGKLFIRPKVKVYQLWFYLG